MIFVSFVALRDFVMNRGAALPPTACHEERRPRRGTKPSFDKTTLRTRVRLVGCSTLIAAGMALAVGLRAETGYDLWLRYVRLTDPIQRASYRQTATAIVVQPQSPTG